MKRWLAALVFFSAALGAHAQAPVQTDVAWPREAKAADGTVITVYQPQLERWADNNLSGRAAVAVLRPGEKEPRYGVLELTARTEIDKSADLVTLTQLRVAKATFPGATDAEIEGYRATLRAAVTKDRWPVSAQALQANLAIAQARAGQKGVAVKNDPPQILFRAAPSMLVLVDGEPVLREVKDRPGVKRVINTTALLVLEESSTTYYLYALGGWRAAQQVTGEWKSAGAPPAVDQLRLALDKQFDPMEGKDSDGKPMFEPGVVPQIVVVTRPTELLQSKGAPQYSPIPGTKLLYVTNSSNDIFMEVGGQQHYVLISGRWFSGKSLQGPWTFVPGKSLPADFTKIPPGHPMADVLSSVPNTTQAREALIANEIPQTATVQRDIQPTPVVYDGGKPEWKAIDGTPLQYAYNTGAPVIQVDAKTYYMTQNGVWFAAAAPDGPWKVATTVPAVIYSIPANSPLHYVTYVRVYSSTPSTVFVGYTPGYYGTVTSSDGVVVYGTGYVYPAYVGTYWYPYPPTYGWGFGFTAGIFWGFAISGGWHNPCCWGGGGGAYVSHHTNININNSYNRWGGKSTSISGPGGRNVKATQVGNTTFAKGSGSNNVYAGRDGNVYRRNEGGDWQKYERGDTKGQGSWSDLDRPDRVDQRDRDRGAENRQRNLSAETRQSLDRQHQSRDAGAARAQQFRSGGGGFQGGGGFRGGGGGGRRR